MKLVAWITLSTLILAFTAFAAGIVWYRWDSAENRGYRFGYYGEFNTVQEGLTTLPETVIRDSGGNEDIVFEEFWFNVEVLERGSMQLWFHDRDPIRRMSGESLAQALRAKIEEELAEMAVAPTSG